MFVILPLSHGSAIISTNQRTACVARTCQHPFRHLSNPTEEYCETGTAQYGSVRVTPNFAGGKRDQCTPNPHTPVETRHNSLGQNVPNVSFHLYADDSVIYCCASMLSKAFQYMQSAFDRVQAQLCQVKLVLNAEETKLIVFSNSEKKVLNQQIVTSQGNEIEVVSS